MNQEGGLIYEKDREREIRILCVDSKLFLGYCLYKWWEQLFLIVIHNFSLSKFDCLFMFGKNTWTNLFIIHSIHSCWVYSNGFLSYL